MRKKAHKKDKSTGEKKSGDEGVKVVEIDDASLEEDGLQEAEFVIEDDSNEEASGTQSMLSLKLRAKEEEAANNHDLYMRARADLENYKVRAKKEREEYVRHANDKVISEFLGIVDNMERALEHSDNPDNEDDYEALLKGVSHINDNMLSVLATLGLKSLEAVGETFDPNLHEAISHEESDEFAPGVVIRVFKKGYYLNDRLLRPASVSVAKESE
jgi:molecular chaperone GrpE